MCFLSDLFVAKFLGIQGLILPVLNKKTCKQFRYFLNSLVQTHLLRLFIISSDQQEMLLKKLIHYQANSLSAISDKHLKYMHIKFGQVTSFCKANYLNTKPTVILASLMKLGSLFVIRKFDLSER